MTAFGVPRPVGPSHPVRALHHCAVEQALRDIKVKMKVSGCWRGLTGARRYLRIRSHLTAARVHGLTAMRAIRDALTGTPWLPPTTA